MQLWSGQSTRLLQLVRRYSVTAKTPPWCTCVHQAQNRSQRRGGRHGRVRLLDFTHASTSREVALAQLQLGRSLLARGQVDAARAALSLARDSLVASPFRARNAREIAQARTLLAAGL